MHKEIVRWVFKDCITAFSMTMMSHHTMVKEKNFGNIFWINIFILPRDKLTH